MDKITLLENQQLQFNIELMKIEQLLLYHMEQM